MVNLSYIVGDSLSLGLGNENKDKENSRLSESPAQFKCQHPFPKPSFEITPYVCIAVHSPDKSIKETPVRIT